ncbi:hypothetical protein QYM36_001925 [Artemia franciscana]|uniref:Uncharacterized protein n=1 Tax=Artemia franciscana TaxID=6661 RepID=A0AA88LGE0_ARTSF|nr:hypothetical protein QYM36_001925 [Artemia franciscana]
MTKVNSSCFPNYAEQSKNKIQGRELADFKSWSPTETVTIDQSDEVIAPITAEHHKRFVKKRDRASLDIKEKLPSGEDSFYEATVPKKRGKKPTATKSTSASERVTIDQSTAVSSPIYTKRQERVAKKRARELIDIDSGDELESLSDKDDFSELKQPGKQRPQKRLRKEKSQRGRKKGRKDSDSNKKDKDVVNVLTQIKWLSVPRLPSSLMTRSTDITIAFRRENYSKSPLFPDLILNQQDWTNSEPIDFYKQEPIPVRIARNDEKIMIQSFTSSGYILNCVEPIRKLAWIPDDKYLIVLTKSFLQLWDMTNKTFKYALHVASDLVNDIVLCPSGSNIESNIPCIGILACASGSNVNLLALPSPKSVKENQIFKVSPNMTLTVPDVKSECSSLCWFKGKGHNKIVAGFFNGLVALWKLSSNSKLIPRNKTNILPILSFYAHTSLVTSVEFCSEFDGRYLVTCGLDKATNIFDLEEVRLNNTPLAQFGSTENRYLEWPIQWPNIIASGDCSEKRRGTNILDIGVGFGQNNLCPGISGVFATAYNPWHDVIAHGTEAGEVICTVNTNPAKDTRYCKASTVRLTLITVEGENGCLTIDDNPVGPGFKEEDCIHFPFNVTGQGSQSISGMAWSDSNELKNILATGTQRGIVHIKDVQNVFEKIRKVKWRDVEAQRKVKQSAITDKAQRNT